MNADQKKWNLHLRPSAFICGLIISLPRLFAAGGLDSLTDDTLLDELARRNQTELLERAFEVKDRPSVIVVPVDYSENLKLTRRLGQLLAH